MYRLLMGSFRRNVIVPLVGLRDSPERIALGVSIGLFVGLTPTVGIQMYAVVGIAAAARLYNVVVGRLGSPARGRSRIILPEIHFNIPAGVAMVWISNPLTMVPMYYAMYALGAFAMGRDATVTFDDFGRMWDTVVNQPSVAATAKAFFAELGQVLSPMFLGGAIWGTLCAVPAYPIAKWLVLRHRERKAAAPDAGRPERAPESPVKSDDGA